MQRVQRSQPGLPTFPGRETHRLNLSLRRAAVTALVVLAAVLFGGGAAQAAVLVNNLDETELTTGPLAVSPTQHLSQGFKTASGGSPTTLTSIDIRLKAAAAMAAPPTVTVHREAQTGPQLASLTGPTSIAAGTTNVTFTAPPGTLLTPGTTYQVLLQHTVANSIEAATTEANDQDGATGWTIWNNLRVRSGPTGNFTAQALALMIRVNGTENATPTLPGPPERFTATARNTAVRLSWTAPGIDGGTPITKYQYRVSADGGTSWNPDWTDVADGGDSGSNAGDETGVTVASLTNGTLYTFQLRAVNSVGTGAAAAVMATPTPTLISNLDETELTTGPLVVSPTQHLSQGFKTASGSSTTLTSIDIRLKAAAAMAAPPTVTIHRGAETAPQLASLTGPTSIAAGTTNVTFTAPPGTLLTPGTAYHVLLQHTVANSIEAATTESDDEDGETDWTIWNNVTARSGPTGNFTAQTLALMIRVNGTANATPTLPGPPESLTAATGDTAVRLSWTAPGIDGGTPITGYEYRHAAGATVPAATTWTSVGTARTATVSELTNGTQYAFEVRAVNSEGAGAAAAVMATPTPPTSGTLVSNAERTISGDSNQILAQQFRTGENTLGYLLSAVNLRATNTSGAIATQTYVTIKNNDGSNPGNRVIARLNNPATFAHGSDTTADTTATNAFTATGSIRLAATTAYWVVVNEGVVAVAERLTLATSTEDAEDSALPDWSIADNRRHKNGDNWNSDTAVLVMALEGHAATVPAVAPGPPQSLTTRPSATVVRLKWAAPEFDGGTPVTSYEYRHAEGDTVPASTAAADWTAVGTKQFARVAGLTNGRQYAFEVRAVNSEGAGAAAKTTAVPTAVFCGEPSLMGRRQIWSETLTVEEYRNRNNIVLFYGFRFGPVDREGNEEQVLYGGLTARTFTASNAELGVEANPETEVSYEIKGVEYNVYEDLYGAPTLQFAIDKALPVEVQLQEGQLVLHICDQSFDSSEISRARIPHSTTDGDVHTYIWDNPGLDWEGISERSLRLSVPGSGGGTLGMPQDFSATPGDMRVVLRWTAPASDGGTAITKYQYRYSAGSTVGASATWTDVPDGDDADTDAGNETTVTVTGLSNDTQYAFEVRAVNSGDGPAATTTPITPTPITISDATLSTLALSNVSDDSPIALSPPFVSDTTSYTASVANEVEQITIAPTPTNNSASVAYLDSSDMPIPDADTMKDGRQVSLEVGENTIKVKVTDAGSTTPQTYTVKVTRARATGTTTGITTGRRSSPSTPPPPPGDVVGYLENPGAASFQSGIGLISGWTCDAEEVEIVLNGEPQEAAYGTARLDTEAVCGDSDNGFGLLFNWNLLGDGEHEVVALVDGVELDRATVMVTTLGAEFLREVTGRCTAADFPTGDETVTLAWQQTQQNFVLVDGPAPAGANRAGTPGEGYLENPGPNSFQSGIGVLSGWACEGTEVVIELNGQPQPAAYGTERLDTEEACGDTANGFGLLFNWNLLGEGEHEVVAFVDGEELGRATVRVTTLGAEFVRDVEGECVVEDFPMPGETVALEWQQNSQNFVIMDVE